MYLECAEEGANTAITELAGGKCQAITKSAMPKC